jgi:hypothetical protein
MGMAQPPKEIQASPQRRGRAGALVADARANAAFAFARMGFADPTLVLRWSEIVGPEVARLAQPLKLTDGPSGGTLTVRAVPGAAVFLAHEKRALAERINAFLGRPAIAHIKFAQGPLPQRPPPPLPQKKPHALPPADPSRRFEGPEGLTEALQALARRR